MFKVSVAGIESADRQLNLLGADNEKKARRAVRAALQGARRDSVKFAQQKYTLPARYITKAMRLKQSGLSGEIKFSGEKNALHRFKNKPKGRITRRGLYIKTEAERGNLKTWKRGFRRKGVPVIFERQGAKRYPIKGLKGPSVPEMVGKFNRQITRSMKLSVLEVLSG